MNIPNQKRVREIMGRNFFGVEEVIRHFGISPTPQQLSVLMEIPFSEVVLEQSNNSHLLVAVLPFSIRDLRGKMQSKGLFYKQDWYLTPHFPRFLQPSFVKEKGRACWQLVRKTEVSNSPDKIWQQQEALLDKDDEVPIAQVMVYAIIGHFLNTGDRLFEKLFVRTSSVLSDGQRVFVGKFSAEGLYLDCGYDDFTDNQGSGDLGVSSARKLNL